MRKIVDAAIADKTAFVIAVHEALKDSSEPRDKPGPLTTVRITGDQATGESQSSIYHLEKAPGQAERKVIDRFRSTYQFRKTNEGWLISGFGGGDVAPPRPVPGQAGTPAAPIRQPARP